jgi:hypothetical protein
VELAQANALIHRFGESVRRFFRAERRSSLISPLFHLPGRLIMGSYCYHEHLVPLLRRVANRMTPEAMAQRAKRLGARPNEINADSLLLGYFNGREQKRLLGVEFKDDAEEITFLLEFWSRFLSAYKSDGKLLPEESDFTLPVLGAESLEALTPALCYETKQVERRSIHRALAIIDLFTFVFNAEARIGIFHHGPYPLPDCSQLLIKEQVGLQDNFYSWASESVRLPLASLACLMRLRGVDVKIGLFGSLRTEPREYNSQIEAYGLFTNAGGELRAIRLEQLKEVAAVAAEAQMRLYRQFLTWDKPQRLAYGAELYGNLLRAFGDAAGLGSEFHQEIRERFQESVARHLESLLGGEPPAILHHIANTDAEIYSPIR